MLHEESGYRGPGRDRYAKPRSHKYVFMSTQSYVHTDIMWSQCLNSQNMFASTSDNSGGPFYPVNTLSPTCSPSWTRPTQGSPSAPLLNTNKNSEEGKAAEEMAWLANCLPRTYGDWVRFPSRNVKSQTCLLSLFCRDRNRRNLGSC